MAKPRVFISSTYYDLRHVRDDLERFVRDLGYEPVRHESGGVPYEREKRLEESAYREVEISDIIVAVVGSRFGTESGAAPGSSISQEELRRALQAGVQVFVFVEQNVLAEFETYRVNKGKDVTYKHVDDKRIYEFLESIYALPQNNPVTPFRSAGEISSFLREQWAGLFQRFLQRQKRQGELDAIRNLETLGNTLKEAVDYLTAAQKDKDEAIKGLLLANHPAFRRFAAVTGAGYRVYFSTQKELDAWLAGRGWKPVPKENRFPESVLEWGHGTDTTYIVLTHPIFDEASKLRVYSNTEWRDEWVQLRLLEPPMPDFPDGPPDDEAGDEDVPF